MPFTHRSRFRHALALCVVALGGGLAQASEEAGEAVDFARDIEPIFKANCYECHGPRRQEGGLRLTLLSSVLRGGDSGEPGVVPGESSASHMVRSLEGADGVKRMPLDGPALSDAEIALIKRWIDAGADWPGQTGQEAGGDPFLQRDHWSLKPVVDPARPQARSDAWCSNDVDGYVLASLKQVGLSPSAQADRRRLIRRVFFTLHGLVPTPEQMERYLSDPRPDWYARMVDDLLDSPRYGERWARHWLDIVRYAETSGFETNLPRPNAFRYRDYVIRAFNSDKPYDQFILDQLAGDTTGEPAATGFIVAGAKDMVPTADQNLVAMQRSNELADMVNVTSTTFTGLTVACARCHHHKFDPILHSDYYAMEAVFAGVQHGDREISARPTPEELASITRKIRWIDAAIDEHEPLASTRPDAPPARPAVDAVRTVERFAPVKARYVRIVIDATSGGLEPCIDELEVYRVADPASGEAGINIALASAGAIPSSSSTYGGNPNHQLAHLNDGRYGNEHSWISGSRGQGWAQITLKQEQVIDRVVWGRDRTTQYGDRLAVDYRIEVATEPDQWRVVARSTDRVRPGQAPPTEVPAVVVSLRAERAELVAQSGPALAYAGTFTQPGLSHRLYRGDPLAKREVVAPNTITVLGSLGLAEDEPEQNRRVALAKSFIDPDHPLTARVMVNRIWQYHFGEGLVATPSDFGAMGAEPTHPELLDYLAARFIESGWSIKQMHRLILNSSTFRQDSAPNDQAMLQDAGNQLLWRFAPRRHEAEVIRDSMLQVTGKLDLSMYGPGFSFFKPNTNYVRVYDHKQTFGPEDWRRMIYGTQVRMERDLTFGGFDCPDAGQPSPKRPRSTTALQALNLFNSPFVLQQAEIFADRLRKDAGDDGPAQVRRAYALLYGREPDAVELRACLDYIHEYDLAALCRVLLNTNEFLFVE